MVILNVNNISLSFGVKEILKNVSFFVNERDRVGVIGVNGSGKTSLFRLILGEYEPDCGEIRIAKDKTVGILKQEVYSGDAADEELSALEYMYKSFPRLVELEQKIALLESGERQDAANLAALHEEYAKSGGLEYKARCASTLQKMGFDAALSGAAVKTLSGGQKTRLTLSRELAREPDLLLLDEPTNHLDIETLGWLEKYLSSWKKSLLVISHDRYFLDRVTDKTLCIEHKGAALYNGNYTASAEVRKKEREAALHRYKEQQKEIARQEAYIAKQRQWNRERNIIAAESRQKLLDKMEKIEKPKDDPKSIKMSFNASAASGNDVLYVKKLCFGYGDTPLIKNADFTVRRGDRLFITGPNGCGKSTLLKLLLGKLMPKSGSVEAGYNVRAAYYDQQNQNINPENTVIDELWNAYPALTQLEIRNVLARFNFTGEDVQKQISVMSGGEKARISFAKLIMSQMNLLVLDEPTNHLDIYSREVLEEAIGNFEGTVVAVSHDRYFLERLATRIIDFSANSETLTDFQIEKKGEAYAELLRVRELFRSEEKETAPAAVSEGKERYLENKRDAANIRREQKRLERLESEARALEQKLAELAEQINIHAADFVKLAALDASKTEAEERLLEIYEEIGV